MASKTYLRYVHSDSFGVIASTGFLSHGALYDPSGTLVFSAALQNVVIWNLRQGSQVGVLCPDGEGALKAQVTTLGISPDTKDIAAGYSDGKIRVWDYAAALKTGAAAKKPGAAPSVTLNGHRAAVLRLAWAPGGALLASGAQDTAVVVWDLVAERGLYRLRGHRDGVTDLAFLLPPAPEEQQEEQEGEGVEEGRRAAAAAAAAGEEGRPRGLVSCGRDALVKVWDLDTQSCCQTVVGHRAEVWGLALHPAGRRLATVAADDQVRVWSVRADRLAAEGGEGSGGGGGGEGGEGGGGGGARVLEYMGSVTRSGKARGSSILFHPKGHLLGICSNSKEAEIWKVRSPAEIKKKHKRRLKRLKEKEVLKEQERKKAEKEKALSAWDVPDEAAGGGEEGPEEEGVAGRASLSEAAQRGVTAADELEPYTAVKASAKIRSLAFAPGATAEGGGRALCALGTNALEAFALTKAARSPLATTLDLPGHRGDVRAVALSADGRLAASAGAGAAKVWNVGTRQAVRALPAGAAPLCCAFGPGDRHLLVGTREGCLALYALGSGEPLQEEAAAHAGAVWALAARPDGRGFATGGADRLVKFWDYELGGGAREEGAGGGGGGGAAEELRFVHTRTLKVEDDVLAVAYSHAREEGKLLLAVATLDSTIRVFHDDSLKFFLSLYGHKLPVMSMDISDDDALLVSGSADKTVKIWGLDFGDCHRSLLAHEDSIMSIKFVRGTHYFFTASKDKTIKYWDADHFEQILVLEGHHAEVWSLAVSNDGSFLISGSHDRSLRVWERTDEPVFLEEEREKEMEAMFEEGLGQPDRDAEENQEGESALASKRTIESVRSGERLMDAIEIAVSEEEAIEEHEKKNKKLDKKGQPRLKDRQPNPLMLGKSPLAYILFTLQQIRPAELEQALLVLSYTFAEPLISFLQRLLARGAEVELAARAAIFLLRTHQAQIIAHHSLVGELTALRWALRRRLEGQKDLLGTNLAGLAYLRRKIEADSNTYLTHDDVGGAGATPEEQALKRLRKG